MFGFKIVKRDWLDRQVEKLKELGRRESELLCCNDKLLCETRELRSRLQLRGFRRLVEDRFDPLARDELLTAFAVGDDEPLLQAVIHVVHAMEIERGDDAGGSGLPAEQAKGYAMAASALKDAQTEILDWVDQANRAKRNLSDA